MPAAPPPAPEEQALSLRITVEEVELDYDGQLYRAANRLTELARPLRRAFHDPVAFGRVLRDAVFHDTLPSSIDDAEREVWADYTTRVGLLRALDDGDVPRRLELLLDEDPSLHEPLWEALVHGGRPLSTREDLPFARRVHPGPTDPGPPERLKLLVAICDHPRIAETGPDANALLAKLAPVKAEAQRARLARGLQRLQSAGLVEVTYLGSPEAPATWESLTQALEEDYTALHLLAHGVMLAEGGFHLVMQRGQDESPFVSSDALLAAISPSLRLAVLASCNSAMSVPGGTINSLGARLAQQVPAVIAMQRPLGIEAAQLFASHFYDDLARSGDPAAALAATRRALLNFDEPRHLNNWPVPVLYRSADAGPLFLAEDSPMDELDPLPEPEPEPEAELEALRDALRVSAPHLNVPRIIQVVSQGRGQGRAKPSTRPQDRERIRARMSQALRLDPVELKAHVLRQDPPLAYSDKMYRQVCAALNARKHVVLIGPPGTGKTTLAHYISEHAAEKAMCAGLLPTTATADWTTFDTIGGYMPTGNEQLSFRPGVFLRSISEGLWLVIDELNRAEIDKAIGELFTAIAGQRVELPYSVEGQPVRVRPPASRDLDRWVPDDARPYDFIIHPNWRIIATMNVYDRSSLYAMSFAFMRRFAFVEVGVPDAATFEGLVDIWSEDLTEPGPVRACLKALIDPQSELMQRRGMGPAIIKDMLRYIEEGARHMQDADALCAEAFLLYAASQLDGLDLEDAAALHHELAGRFAEGEAREELLERVRELYPAMPASGWTTPDDG